MQQPRKRLKELRTAARCGDSGAARLLLAHSISVGHDRLSVHRYFAARALGVDVEQWRPACRMSARRLPRQAVLEIAQKNMQGVHQGDPAKLAKELYHLVGFDDMASAG